MTATPARWERAALTVLPAALGAGVFAVAFVHVHDVARWAGQPNWASWMLACTGELMSIAAGAAILACRRTKGASIFWPVVVLLAAIAFSGACNLRAAGEGKDALKKHDPGAWVQIMAVWPVVAFGLVSILKVSTPHGGRDDDQADVAGDRRPAQDGGDPQQPAAAPTVVPAPAPAVVPVTVTARTVESAPSVPNGPVPPGTEGRDGAVRNGSAARSRSAASRSRSGSGSRSGTAGARSADAAGARTRRQYPDDAALTEAARAAGPGLAERGELTRDGLRAELGVSATRAGQVLPVAREAARKAAEAARSGGAQTPPAGEVDEVTGWVPATPELVAVPTPTAAAPVLSSPEPAPELVGMALAGGTSELAAASRAGGGYAV